MDFDKEVIPHEYHFLLKTIFSFKKRFSLKQFFFFFHFWLCWVFVAVSRLFPVVASGGYSPVEVQGASHCGGFSCGAWALGT